MPSTAAKPAAAGSTSSCEIMQHEETVLAQRDKLGHEQRRSPASLVDVATNDMRGRNFAKPIDHLGFADVTGVDNHV